MIKVEKLKKNIAVPLKELKPGDFYLVVSGGNHIYMVLEDKEAIFITSKNESDDPIKNKWYRKDHKIDDNELVYPIECYLTIIE